ncbi:MAG TPA: hypothetical protein VD884_06610 [Ohtaekwangia sp.]|nr:hypothetical protein [Ohtaekwangia sp.]
MKTIATLIMLFSTIASVGQPNCFVYEGDCKKACELFLNTPYQGKWESQKLYDSAIALCPDFSFAHHERSVAFLKNGEFTQWREYMDQAVELNPKTFLGNRGWCRFKFLHDYKGALEDLNALQKLNKGFLGWSGDGDYDLRVVMALCYRELGDIKHALTLFDEYFLEKENQANGLSAGSFDYLHYGVTRLKNGEREQALAALKQQVKIYKQLPDTYYYIAMIHKDQGNTDLATENLLLANKFMQEGYSRKDPYCEALDEVYPTDIRKAMAHKE